MKKEKEKLVKKKACFNYRILEYFANKCCKLKKSQGTASHGTRQQVATAIYIYTSNESSMEEILEIDNELLE